MSMLTFQVLINRLLFLGGIWFMLTGLDLKALALGAVVVPVAIWLSLRLLPGQRRLILWRLALHLPAFVVGSVRGGLDVAWRAFSPHLPLDPGWIDVPVKLSDGGRAVMGGELSLMPGTLAAGTQKDRLLIHVLDTQAGFERSFSREEAAIAAMTQDVSSGDKAS